MLLGADHVRDLEVVVVDHVGQVIEARAVGPLDDVVLLAGPIELDPAADQVVEHERALAGHLQPHDGLPALGLESGPIGRRLGHEAAAVAKRAASRVSAASRSACSSSVVA